MQPEVLYIFATFALFEVGNLVENECNILEYESVLDSIYQSSTENAYGDGSINTKAIEDIWDGKYVHPEINARDACTYILLL